MKKVILWGYWCKNLGDDLFLISIVNRLRHNKNVQIYISCERRYKSYYESLGVKVYCYDSFFNKVVSKLIGRSSYFEKARNNYFLMLGGSLFAENKGEEAEKHQFECLKYAVSISASSAVVGSNFGPFISKEFYNNYRTLFTEVDFVCFRDLYSKELFDELDNVYYAPDIVLAGEWDKQKDRNVTKQNTVIISVMDLYSRSTLKTKADDYEKTMAKIAQFHANKGDSVVLLAFCAAEGDHFACERVKEMCYACDRISIVTYEKQDTLEIISTAKKMYASRFHSIILALYYRIDCIPFKYNEKTQKALESYSDDFDTIDILEIGKYEINKIVTERNKIRANISLCTDSLKQFEWIDKIMRSGDL